MSEFQVYKDLAERTGGEFYLGICGPVRTGKSTFIKRFMELLVLPEMEQEHERQRAVDELPQSAAGKTIMTTEPKFIPKEAANVKLFGENEVKIRLIDCVGYIVKGAEGLYEEQNERMVMTPWSESPMPFTQAAEFGTRKVIHDHSTIGIVVTTDGSFGDLPREAFEDPEKRTIQELTAIGKPFVVLVNSAKPYGSETAALVEKLEQTYHAVAMAVNCNQLRREDVLAILEKILSSFSVRQLAFHLPKWVEMLPQDHWLKQELVQKVRMILGGISRLCDVTAANLAITSDAIKGFRIGRIGMENGEVRIDTLFDDGRYYQILSELVGTQIDDEYQLIHLLREYADNHAEIDKLKNAWEEVHRKGYGVVTPSVDEIEIDQPELIKHGSKYGVKLRAVSPSIHLIQANIETEIAPIVGTQEQANDLIAYIADQHGEDDEKGIWDTNIFGKTVRQLVEEGMDTKVDRLGDESRIKLQETIQKVVNDGNGGLVCIII